MDWVTITGLTAGSLIIFFSLLRVERRALWVVVLLLLLPAALAIGRWASVGDHWPEVFVGVGIALVITIIWWVWVGRRLPAPTSDNIRVWGQEAGPRKSRAQERAELQAEILRLREEAARMEAEIQRLKSQGAQGGDKPPQGPGQPG